MPFRINPHAPISSEFKRITRETIEDAIQQLTDPTIEQDQGIHDARKDFKKIRAVLRLVRPGLGKIYALENARFRDVGRALSEVRDAEALLETAQDMEDEFHRAVGSQTLRVVMNDLEEYKSTVSESGRPLDHRVKEVADTLRVAWSEVHQWPLEETGFDVPEKGLKRLYRSGRKSMAKARRVRNDGEAFHEWRKSVKYLWYQSQVLQPLDPKKIKKRIRRLKKLSRHLGDDHDLLVLHETLLNTSVGDILTPSRRTNLIQTIERRQFQLRRKALKIGRKMYKDKPSRFAKQHRKRWQQLQCG